MADKQCPWANQFQLRETRPKYREKPHKLLQVGVTPTPATSLRLPLSLRATARQASEMKQAKVVRESRIGIPPWRDAGANPVGHPNSQPSTTVTLIHMRSDMHKVITERPRAGRSWATQFPRPMLPFDEQPKFQGIKRPHRNRKYFSDLLGPLKRWLQAQVGRRWNDVYSEACAVIKPDSVVRAHIKTHLLDFVERQTLMKNGGVWCFAKWGVDGEVPVATTAGPWKRFYVHPESGLLCAMPVYRRKQRRRSHDSESIWLSDTLVLRKLKGVWFECSIQLFPTEFERGSSPWRWDYAEATEVNQSKAYATYGRLVYCVSKRQLSRREMKIRGLRNGPVPVGLLACRLRRVSSPTGSAFVSLNSVSSLMNFTLYLAAGRITEGGNYE